jgi:hypothetical protein
MKPFPHHQKIGIPAFSLLALLLVFLPLRASGSPPAWWYERGVITTNPPADYTAITQGQLKYLATAAAAELDAHFTSPWASGAGDTIHAMIASWSTPTTNTTDYNAVTLGQLKNVAQPFYDQLGYGGSYPWSYPANTASDYNVANIGQAKQLFSFDVTGDAIPHWWQHYYAINYPNMQSGNGLTYFQAFTERHYYHGATPTLSIVNGNNQTGPVNGLLPQPLIVSVTDGNGNPYVGAPVSFTTGAGTLQGSSIGTPATTITARSDSSGLAKAFLTLPTTHNATVTISASTGSAQTSFSEQSDNGSGTNTYVNPFVPSQVTANVNVDGSVDITWVNNADPNDPRPIQVAYMDTNNTMQTITTVPAGSTSYHVPPQ